MYSSDKKPLNLCDVLSTISDSGYNWSMTLTIVTTMMLRLTSINMKELSKKMNLLVYLFFSNKLDISKLLLSDLINYNIRIEIIKKEVTNEMLKIVKYLILNNMLKEFKLNFNNIGPNINKILSVLENENNSLNSLDLSHNNIRNNGVEELAQLTCLTKLTSLKLRHNNIFNNGAKIIAGTLLNSLISIDLSINMIGAIGATSISTAITNKKSKLKELNIAFNCIGPEGATSLAEALKSNMNLTNLNIASNRIGSKGATSLAEALKSNINLTNLNIAFNHIGPKGTKSLAEALKSDRLVALNLLNNYIGSEGAKSLAEALKSNINLTNLNIACNRIGSKGAKSLAEALKNARLVDLNLSNNKIGDNGASYFALAFFKGLRMTDNHILWFKGLPITHLDLSLNNIGNIGVKSLAIALESDNSLVHLNLANNKIGDIGAARLAKTLSCQCARLSCLKIYNNNISDNIASLYS
jgi:Ran GTPase-activating protein (RanGAP) involved in mRNA processing and transport